MKKKTKKVVKKIVEEVKLPPKALIVPLQKDTDYMRGRIVYEARCNDWMPFLTTKEPQKFKYDSNGCSQCSGMNCLETQLNFLKNDFTEEALKWFKDNGYFDDNGNFDFSWRFTGILAGTTIDGNSQVSFWDSVRHYGLLPHKDLNYTLEQSQKFDSQEDMCKDFWNLDAITPAMLAKAKQVLKYIDVEYEYVWYNLNKFAPVFLIANEVKQAPLHIGTPACFTWNSGNVKACGQTHPAHATMLFAVNADSSTQIRDQYNPFDKTLSNDYPISVIVKGVVTTKSQVSDKTPVKFSALIQFLLLLKKLGILVLKGVRMGLNDER